MEMRMRKSLKIASRLSWIVIIAYILFKMTEANGIYRSATPTPEPATGHVIQLEVHGRYIYITADQAKRKYGADWPVIFIGLVLLSVIAVERNINFRDAP